MKYIFNNILKSSLKTSPYIDIGSTTIFSWVYSRIRKKITVVSAIKILYIFLKNGDKFFLYFWFKIFFILQNTFLRFLQSPARPPPPHHFTSRWNLKVPGLVSWQCRNTGYDWHLWVSVQMNSAIVWSYPCASQ